MALLKVILTHSGAGSWGCCEKGTNGLGNGLCGFQEAPLIGGPTFQGRERCTNPSGLHVVSRGFK